MSVSTWDRTLTNDILAHKVTYGDLPLRPERLLDIELVLTLMKEYFAGQDPALAWTILGGHPLPALAALPKEGRCAVAVVRHRLPWLLGRGSWERDLARYWAVPAHYRLYCCEEGRIGLHGTPVRPDREHIMRDLLCAPPPLESRPARYASAGTYRFSVRREIHEVEIPGRVAEVARTVVPRLATSGRTQRDPLVIPLAELQAEADWMDRHASPRSVADALWGQRLRQVTLSAIAGAGIIDSDNPVLTLDGVLHLIGMVGSGKSSLLLVLAVYLARRGYRVTLVQGDVASLLHNQAIFEALRAADPDALVAVPLVGRSSRVAHLNRLHHSEALRQGEASLSSQHSTKLSVHKKRLSP
jgi:hypothetical protein